MEFINQVTDDEAANSSSKRLYRIGGYAALVAVAIALIEGIVILIIQVVWLNPGQFGASSGGQPSTTIGWFHLFENNRLVGLLDDAVLR